MFDNETGFQKANRPEMTIKAVQNLINEGDPDKMLQMIPNFRCPNLRQELYCAAAGRYFERNDPVRAKRILADTLDMIRREKQTKSSAAQAMAEVALIQGKLFGREGAKRLLDLGDRSIHFRRRSGYREIQ